MEQHKTVASCTRFIVFFISCFQRHVVPPRGVPLFQQLTPKQWQFSTMCAPAVKTTPITFFSTEKPRLFLFFFLHVPGVGLNIIYGSQTTRRWFAIIISCATSLNINFLRDVLALLHSSFHFGGHNLFCVSPPVSWQENTVFSYMIKKNKTKHSEINALMLKPSVSSSSCSMNFRESSWSRRNKKFHKNITCQLSTQEEAPQPHRRGFLY